MGISRDELQEYDVAIKILSDFYDGPIIFSIWGAAKLPKRPFFVGEDETNSSSREAPKDKSSGNIGLTDAPPLSHLFHSCHHSDGTAQVEVFLDCSIDTIDGDFVEAITLLVKPLRTALAVLVVGKYVGDAQSARH